MKKITLIFALLVLLPVSLKADDNAALQMRLASDTAFQQRVTYLLMKQAFVILAESPGTTNHTNRVNFAIIVKNSINSVMPNYIVYLVGRPNLVAEITTCSGTPVVCTTTATDAEIDSQIFTDWNLWAGQ